MLQDLYDFELKDQDDPNWKPYTEKEWSDVQRRQEAIKKDSQQPEHSLTWFKLIDRYYSKVIPQ